MRAVSGTRVEDFVEGRLDLNRHLIKHPAATFFVRVSGDSMIGASIRPDDILVVDRTVRPQDGCIVIASIEDELTVKTYKTSGETIYLVPANDEYEPLEITPEMEFQVWGVVTWTVRSLL